MNLTRKRFLTGTACSCAAFALKAAQNQKSGETPLPQGGTQRKSGETPLPQWRPGEMDVHFIHTGVGEQTFFIFPDGTTLLLDCGFVGHRKPAYVESIPPLPSGKLRGGEWVARYLLRVAPKREIDCILVSHAHDDHVQGLPDVAKAFAFKRWIDNGYPLAAGEAADSKKGHRSRDADATSLRVLREFVSAARAKGMQYEPFAVGARDQIALQHGGARAWGAFEIRNLCANGVLWDGANGTRDYVAEHMRLNPKKPVGENQLSNAIRIRYGGFTYYTGGDVELDLTTEDGTTDWEACVGHVAGPANVCKTNHHAYWNAMHAGFVKEIRARCYLSSVWSPQQINDRNLPLICSRALYPGPRTIFHGTFPKGMPGVFGDAAFVKDFAPFAGHHVVKVAPGGTSWKIYTLDAHDESMRVMAVQEFRSLGV